MGLCASADAEHPNSNIFLKEEYSNYKVMFTTEQLNSIFDKYDIDDDKELQLGELEKLVKDMLDGVLQIQIEKLKGRRGLRKLLTKYEQRIQKAKENYKFHAHRLYKHCDKDEDGKVCKKEFINHIESVQKSRREGVIGVIAAGDVGSLIRTHSQFMEKKKKEGDLYDVSRRAESKYSNRSTSTNKSEEIIKDDVQLQMPSTVPEEASKDKNPTAAEEKETALEEQVEGRPVTPPAVEVKDDDEDEEDEHADGGEQNAGEEEVRAIKGEQKDGEEKEEQTADEKMTNEEQTAEEEVKTSITGEEEGKSDGGEAVEDAGLEAFMGNDASEGGAADVGKQAEGGEPEDAGDERANSKAQPEHEGTEIPLD